MSRSVNEVSQEDEGELQEKRLCLRGKSVVRERDRRWSWVEIDLGAIRHNIRQYRNRLSKTTRLLAVVKADAYGHGAVKVARCALEEGASYLAVATLDEGIELREAGVIAPILILSEPPEESVSLLLAYDIMPSVYSRRFAEAYACTAALNDLPAPFHLAINSGMNRIGVEYENAVSFMRGIAQLPSLECKGVFTHFATADAKDDADFRIQLKRFSDAVSSLESAGIEHGVAHASNTAAGIRYPEANFDMARLGISMYGLHASDETKPLVDLKPAMSVHARITDVRKLAASEGVSYGLKYRSSGDAVVATLPLGYADGLSRSLSGRIDILMNGKRYRQIGSICMDQCMFLCGRGAAATDSETAHYGDRVVLVGTDRQETVTLDEYAALQNTINYEIACDFGMRLKKVYV